MRRLELHDEIFALASEMCGLKFFGRTIYTGGKALPYDDYVDILLRKGISVEGDEIDAVLIWGDGTVEFHLRDECDAFNWSEYDDSVLEQVLNDLRDSYAHYVH